VMCAALRSDAVTAVDSEVSADRLTSTHGHEPAAAAAAAVADNDNDKSIVADEPVLPIRHRKSRPGDDTTIR